MQLRRKPRRVLFGKRAKEAFLESLGATGNVTASAEAAGVAPGTVYNHRRRDPEFRAAWWMALEQSVAKLVALRVQRELERAERAQRPPSHEAAADEGLAVRLDGPPDERQIADLIKLMAMLRDLCRNLSGEERKPSRAPQSASAEEVMAALEKRLKAYRRRREAEAAARPQPDAAAGPHPPIADAMGPSLSRNGRGDGDSHS